MICVGLESHIIVVPKEIDIEAIRTIGMLE